MSTFNQLLKEALQKNAIHLTDRIQLKLVRYLELMQTWNRVFNLTTITDPRHMVYLHLIDSLAVQPFLVGKRMLDVGTGAGLPGIPLAIVNDDQYWVLLDKNSKKTRFLTQVVAELGLGNAQALHGHNEKIHPEACFDTIVSRAFGTIEMFAKTSAHLLCPKGILVAMKGKFPRDEIDKIPKQFQIQDVTRLNIKGMDIERHIVSLQLKQ